MVNQPNFDEFMHCAAFIRYELTQKEKGLIRKEQYVEKRPDKKGFLLRGITVNKGDPTQLSIPRLASFRGNIGADNSIDVQREGIVTLYSSSASASEYDSPARRSLTCVLVASDNNPFIAQVRSKGRISTVTCDDKGLHGGLHDKEEAKKVKPAGTKDPAQVLKLRLAKGEITMDQYNELRRVLESG